MNRQMRDEVVKKSQEYRDLQQEVVDAYKDDRIGDHFVLDGDDDDDDDDGDGEDEGYQKAQIQDKPQMVKLDDMEGRKSNSSLVDLNLKVNEDSSGYDMDEDFQNYNF